MAEFTQLFSDPVDLGLQCADQSLCRRPFPNLRKIGCSPKSQSLPGFDLGVAVQGLTSRVSFSYMMHNKIFCVVLVLFSVSTSYAQQLQRDKEDDIFYKIGAGARFRQYYFQDAAAGALPNDEDIVASSHRAQLDLAVNKGEYFKTFFRAIHRGTWGEDQQDQDTFLLSQAYGDWKVTDFLNLRFGRQAVQIGRGLVFGENDWENTPTYYDGAVAHFDWEALEFSLYALKVYELNKVAGQSVSDPELSNYILDINFKDLSDYIKVASLNLVQVDGDIGQVPNSTTILKKQSIQRFGFDLVTDGVNFQAAASMNYVTGTELITDPESKVKQYMADGELRLLLPDYNDLQLWVGGHMDSGDDDPTDGTNSQYEPLNYNFHVNGGRLDLLKFGNLTFARSGVSAVFWGGWQFGFEAFLFQKTQAAAPTNFFRTPIADEFSVGTYVLANEKSLGTEFDLWMSRTFPSGVVLELSLNTFSPGGALKGATDIATNQPLGMNNQIYNLILDVGYFF